jgi:hypothetical protein
VRLLPAVVGNLNRVHYFSCDRNAAQELERRTKKGGEEGGAGGVPNHHAHGPEEGLEVVRQLCHAVDRQFRSQRLYTSI